MKNSFAEEQIITKSYSYNEQGELVEKKNGNYITTYTYNSAGQLTEQNFHYLSEEGDFKWQEKTEFQYRNGKISKGIVYSKDDEILQYITYKYDSRGNTLERNVHSHSSDSKLILAQTKFRYNSKTNSHAYSGVNMLNGYIFTHYADIKQMNNPVYSSYFNLVSSSMPPEFEITYEYNSKGLPIKAKMNNLLVPNQKSVELFYEYQGY